MHFSKRNDGKALKQKIATNVTLGVLVLSVSALCFAPSNGEIVAVKEDEVYRQAGENGVGVSLMFNVYWGTDEVYQILDVLKEYGATATFFIGGSWADDNVKCLRDIYAQGHEIGNHGYFHKDHKTLSVSQNEEEISSCNRFIQLVIGKAPVLFAPPSGSYGKDMLSACQALQMQTILWSKDTVDWRDKDKSVIYTRATEGISKGDFVLMHPMEATVAALRDILKYYEENSLQAVSVSANLQNEG